MTDSYTKHFPVSWEELHRNGKALAWHVLGKGPLQDGQWKGIIGIARGGLVPACIIARELNVRLIETLCIASYDHTKQEDITVLEKPYAVETGGEGWLVIDDLVDTGQTFKIARELLPKAHFASIYAKPEGVPFADTYITEVSQDTWIHFPWDLEAQYSQPIAEQEN